MKKILRILTLGTLLTLSAPANSEHEIGNGGNAIVCYRDATKREIRSVELMDYWEMAQVYPQWQNLDLGSPRVSVKDKIETFLKRVAKFEPEKAKRIGSIANQINENIQEYLLPDLPLDTIDDDHPQRMPAPPCYKEQLAIQYQDLTTTRRRFAISNRLFQHPAADNDLRAGIILHESIYRDAILAGHNNSDAIRVYHYMMASRMGSAISTPEYIQKTESLAYLFDRCRPYYFENINMSAVLIKGEFNGKLTTSAVCGKTSAETNDFRIELIKNSSIVYDTSGNVTSIVGRGYGDKLTVHPKLKNGARTHAQMTFDVRQDFGALRLHFEPTSGKIHWLDACANNTSGEIYVDSGSQRMSCFIGRGTIQNDPTLPVFPDCSRATRIFFNSNFEATGCTPKPGAKWRFQGQEFVMKRNEVYMTFDIHENGEVKGLPLNGTGNFRTKKGMKVELGNSYIKFDDAGFVESGGFKTPKKVDKDGLPYMVTFISADEDGGYRGTATVKLPLTWQGRRILSSNYRISDLCSRLEYRVYPWSEITGKNQTIFVGRSEEFYDPVFGKFVLKTDESVEIFDPSGSLKCFGGLTLNW